MVDRVKETTTGMRGNYRIGVNGIIETTTRGDDRIGVTLTTDEDEVIVVVVQSLRALALGEDDWPPPRTDADFQ